MAGAIFGAVGDRFFAELGTYDDREFTGCLEMQVGPKTWRIYLTLGRLVWVDGGIHPWRRWHRQVDRIKTAAARTAAARIESESSTEIASPIYGILLELLRQKQLEAPEVAAISRDAAREALFDALWVMEWQGDYTLEAQGNRRPAQFNLPHTLLATLGSLRDDLQKEWTSWCERGLKGCRPSWAPEIVQPELLKVKTNPATYQMLSTLLDGKRTLRDLAAAMQRDLESLTAMLQPYVRRGWIEWKDVADTAAGAMPAEGTPVEGVADLRAGAIKTVAAVDDSPQTLKILEAVATNNQYRFIGISDSVKALAILLEQQPDVIFVDMVMPVLNGFELCQKIRRVAALRETPIVLLSSNLIDQVRAVLAGADESITKPATIEQLAQAMQRYCQKDAIAGAKATPVAGNATGGEALPAVACVDDCNLTQNIIKTVVTGQGFRFLGISGSLAAIASLVEFKPDLVLLDLVMPTMDGYELCERLREHEVLRDTPIVIFSGNPIDRARATAAGVTAYFNKPLTPDKMSQVLAYLG